MSLHCDQDVVNYYKNHNYLTIGLVIPVADSNRITFNVISYLLSSSRFAGPQLDISGYQLIATFT